MCFFWEGCQQQVIHFGTAQKQQLKQQQKQQQKDRRKSTKKQHK